MKGSGYGDLYIIRAVNEDGDTGYELWSWGMSNKFLCIPSKRLCFNVSLDVIEAAKKHLENV